MSYRLAYSLEQLRVEVNMRWPNRSKVSDGWIGDPAHAATASDHNPNAAGVVCALDITNDPNGPTAQALFDMIRTNPQPDCKYIIANRQIASKKYDWSVRDYTGSDPHTSHIHVSVGVGPDGQSVQPYDDTLPWLPTPKPQPPAKVNGMTDSCVHDGKMVYVVVDPKQAVWIKTEGYDWEPLDGIITTGIAVNVQGDFLVVSGRGQNGELWVRKQGASGWGTWFTEGGNIHT